MTPEETRVVRYLSVVSGRTSEQIAVACHVDVATVDRLWQSGKVVRRVRDNGDPVHFASLTGVQDAMSAQGIPMRDSDLPGEMKWKQ